MVDRREPVDRRKRAPERREYSRMQAATSVRFLRSGATADEVLVAELIDVSHSGVSIVVDRPLICGECIAIEVRDADQYCCNLAAQTVWVESDNPHQHRAGCELRVELSRKQFLMLQELVSCGPNRPSPATR